MVMVTKEMAPEVGGGSNGADNVFKTTCIKLTGPSAEKLGEAFYGPGIVVLQEIKGKEKGAADAADPENSKELIINRIVRGALMQPPPGYGGEQVTEREGAMAEVKPAPVPPTRIIAGTSGVGKTIKVLKQYRIVLLGRRGAGKSSLANTIFGEDVFKIHHTTICGASECQTKSKSVHGRRIIVVDTPGFFDTDRHEEEMKTWITECSPGPHVFLIVLKVENFTEQEKDAIDKMCQFFSEEALKYAVVVFTHGDQLPEGMKIEEFVGQEKCLSDLVKKCGGRCHIVDIKNRKNQVAELLSTIDKLVIENKGGCYTNKMLQAAERETEETGNKESVGNMLEGDSSKTKNKSVSKNTWMKLTGPAAESMVEAFFSPAVVVLQDTEEATDRAAEKVQAGKKVKEEREVVEVETDDDGKVEVEDPPKAKGGDEAGEDSSKEDKAKKEEEKNTGKRTKRSPEGQKGEKGSGFGNFLFWFLGGLTEIIWGAFGVVSGGVGALVSGGVGALVSGGVGALVSGGVGALVSRGLGALISKVVATAVGVWGLIKTSRKL